MNECQRLEFFHRFLIMWVAIKVSGRKMRDLKSHFRNVSLIQGGG